MICDHPQCTGVHSGSRPYREWCPRRKERNREAVDRYQATVKGQQARTRERANRRAERGDHGEAD